MNLFVYIRQQCVSICYQTDSDNAVVVFRKLIIKESPSLLSTQTQTQTNTTSSNEYEDVPSRDDDGILCNCGRCYE